MSSVKELYDTIGDMPGTFLPRVRSVKRGNGDGSDCPAVSPPLCGIISLSRSQAVARIADRTAKNCKGHVT